MDCWFDKSIAIERRGIESQKDVRLKGEEGKKKEVDYWIISIGK